MAESNLDIILRIKKQGTGAKEAEKEMRSLTDAVDSTKNIMGGAAVAAGVLTGVYQASIAPTLEYAGQVRELSRTIGATAEESSRLIQAADDVGVSADTLGRAMEAAIRKGVSPTIEGMGQLADKYNSIQDPIARTKFLMDTFGKSGADLAPLMAQGSKGIAELGRQADMLGLTLSGEAVQNARNLEIAMDGLGDAFQGATYAVGNEFIPILTEATNTLTLLLTAHQQIVAAIQAHSAEVAMSAATYADYEAELRRVAEAQGLTITAGGDLIRIHAGSAGATVELVQANYLLTESERNAQIQMAGWEGITDRAADGFRDMSLAQAEAAAAGDIAKKVWLEAQKGLNDLNLSTEKRIELEQRLALASGAMTAEDLIRQENVKNLAEQLSMGLISQEEYIAKLTELSEGAVTVTTSFEQLGYGVVTFSAEADKVVPVLQKETKELHLQKPAAEAATTAFFQYGELLNEQMKPGGSIERYIIGLSKITGEAMAAGNAIKAIPPISGAGSGGTLTVGAPRADGGPVSRGVAYPVGEEGPELFVAPSNGYIVPNSESNSGGSGLAGFGGGSQTIVIPVVLDGREVTRIVVDNIDDELTARGRMIPALP